MCGGGPLPGNPTSSNNANAPPVSLPSALNVTSSRSPIQTDLPSPAATWVVLTVDFLLPCWYDVTLADYRLPSIRTPPRSPSAASCPARLPFARRHVGGAHGGLSPPLLVRRYPSGLPSAKHKNPTPRRTPPELPTTLSRSEE